MGASGSRERLDRASRLHWFHWAILGVSACVTVGVYILTVQANDRVLEARFEQRAQLVHDLIVDRMTKYEDGLWAGVSHLRSVGGDVDVDGWNYFAGSMAIDRKYPGINGLGIIHHVSADRLPAYVDQQRQQRPDFTVHPQHTVGEYWPITFIEPMATNAKAVGLDMAHEDNRFTAAKLARQTGEAQITGPIVLVQDSGNTPGFLFSAPWYRDPQPTNDAQRVERFVGLVYAPFVVKRLIEGTLAQSTRPVLLRLTDGDEVLYDELNEQTSGLEPDPRFRWERQMPMYGRTWTLTVWSAQGFGRGVEGAQPIIVLVLGVLIEALVLWFMLTVTRANRQALALADQVSADLEVANEDLLQFNYRISHDLVAPLRTIQGYVEVLREDLAEGDVDNAGQWLDRIDEQSQRLTGLVTRLLDLARLDHADIQGAPLDLDALVGEIRAGLAADIEERGVTVRSSCALQPPMESDARRMEQVLENLISNAVRYSDPDKDESWVEVTARRDGQDVVLDVTDNGIGVPEELGDRVFEMFVRGGRESGGGLGLYMVRKHVERLHGHIQLIRLEDGTRFRLRLPGRVTP